MPDHELGDAYAQYAGVNVPKHRLRMLIKFAWSAKGRGLLRVSEGNWDLGSASPEPDSRWGEWTMAALKARAGEILDGPADPFEQLTAEVQDGRPGRVPKLVMSVIGTALNEVRRGT